MRKGEREEGREVTRKHHAALTLQLSSCMKQFWFFANKALVTGSLVPSENFAYEYGREAATCSPNLLPFSPGSTAR